MRHAILRRFGFYLCGPPVTVTRRGQYFILYESHDYDDSLLDAARTAVDAAGLTRGNFTECVCATMRDDHRTP